MTNKEKLHSIPLVLIAVVFVFLVSNSSVALAAQETRLSEDIGENGKPAIYGDKVVWAHWDKIHLYDLKTGNDTTITMPEHYHAARPAIYDNKIVWCLYNDTENSNTLCMYDIPTSTSSLITENLFYYCAPDIYGDRIVWAWERNYKTDIYMYEISTQMQTQITTSGSANNPAIYENKIVWVDYGRNGTAIDKNNNSLSRSDIYMYDLSTKKETRISTSGRASNPAIYGDRIVWQDRRNLDFITGMGDIYTYNLSTEKESRISYSEQSSPSSPPSIYGDRTVWIDYRNGNWDIYMYDLSTSRETQITTSGGAMEPDIYGDIIVDRDNREGLPPGDGYFFDIYMYNLTVKHIKPQASFISNLTYGNAPLAVLFTDTSTGEAPTSWYWDFGDGINSKHAMNATHTFTKPGNYTISLTVENAVGNNTTTMPSYIVVTDPNAPVADFNSNVTEGYAPLTVQFNDISQKATSRIWDFNSDGQTDSSDIKPVYMYSNAGIYTVNLTVSNENGTASKTAVINVLTPSSSSGDSSSGSSHTSSGSSGGGGAGGSPEPAKNVEFKEISQAFITNGKPVKFDFPQNATCVVYVNFDAKKTAGKTSAIAEQLKGKSTLVSDLNAGDAYKYFNVWVGTGGFATSKNIENPVLCFKVEKAWIRDKNIDKSSIALNRYSDKRWSQLPVKLLSEDSKYLYFTAETLEFSFFAITGTAKPSEKTVTGIQPASNEKINENNTENKEPQNQQKEILKTPSFEVYYGVTGLLAVFMYKRK